MASCPPTYMGAKTDERVTGITDGRMVVDDTPLFGGYMVVFHPSDEVTMERYQFNDKGEEKVVNRLSTLERSQLKRWLRNEMAIGVTTSTYAGLAAKATDELGFTVTRWNVSSVVKTLRRF